MQTDTQQSILVSKSRAVVLETGPVICQRCRRAFAHLQLEEIKGITQQGEPDEVEPTESQRRILELLANGRNQKQAAQVLGVEPDTVRQHLRRVRERLRVSTTWQAVALLAKRGKIRVDDYPRRQN